MHRQKKPGNAGQNTFRIQDYTLDECLSHLQGVIECGTGYKALCPSHRDTNPSLSIDIGKNGRPVLHCHAGCSYDSIMAAMGLDRSGTRQPSRQPTTKQITALYDYCDEQGLLLYQKVRYEPKSFVIRRPDGVGWTWSKGDTRPVLYRLPEVIQAIAAGKVIFIPEGEKDVDRLRSAGLVATTNIEGASEPGKRPKWRREYSEQLAGAPRVVLLPDSDPAGEAHAEYIARQLAGKVDDIRLVTLPGLSPKGDVSDWLDAGHTTNELLALAEAIAPYANPAQDHHNAEAPERERPPLSAYEDAPEAQGTRDRSAGANRQFPGDKSKNGTPIKRIGDLLKEGYTYDWLIKYWIECLQTIVIFGDSQSCKTLLAIDLACCIALGIDWLGCRVKPGAVVFVVGEGAGAGIRRRFRAWEIANGYSLADAPIYIVEQPTTLPLDAARLMADIRATIEQDNVPLQIMFLDTLSRTLSGSERDSKDFCAYQRALDDIRAAFKCAAAFLHHVGHGDKSRERGASEIPGNTDVRLRMDILPDGIRQITALKVKDGATPDPLFFKLTVVELGELDEDGDPITSVVLRQIQGYQLEQRPLSKNSKLLLAVLTNLLMTDMHPDGVTITTTLRAAFYQTLRRNKPDLEADSLRTIFSRALSALWEAGKIAYTGIDNTRVRLAEPEETDA